MNAYKNKVFISYKRVDKELVFKLKDLIENKLCPGLCWVDLDGIESDAQFGRVIVKAINKADVFLFMYSFAHSQIEDFDNDWTVREINYANKRKKRIVFVRLDDTPLTDDFEFYFGLKQQIDAHKESAVNKLIDDLRNWLAMGLNVEQIVDSLDKEVGHLTLIKGLDGKYGFQNSAKQVVIPFQWDEAWPFQAGLARVRNADKMIGYIDKKGYLRLKCRWIDAKSFSEGLAAVKDKDGNWGYINKMDEVVIPCQWRNAKDFKDGIATVQAYSGINWSIDKTGHTIGHPKDSSQYRG